MSNTSRFTTSNKTTQERLTTNTVGLATLDDFRKRRAEVLEEQERAAREAALGNPTPPNRSLTSTPANASDTSTGPPKKKKKKKGVIKLSFEDGDEQEEVPVKTTKLKPKKDAHDNDDGNDESGGDSETKREDAVAKKKRLAANANVAVVPKSVTKAALRKQVAEREALRKEFLALQIRVKETEIAIPFVFYDGSDIPGGMVRVKKGDHVWLFLDKSRKVGAELKVGGEKNATKEWARVGVDDLLMVRGGLIIPHHYEFYFFIMNKTVGPGGVRLFEYRAEAEAEKEPDPQQEQQEPPEKEMEDYDPLAPPAPKPQTPIKLLEGATNDPSFTKVVDRRWYERNKHIFPASTWQEFDPEKDYTVAIRRDTRGNAFFY